MDYNMLTIDDIHKREYNELFGDLRSLMNQKEVLSDCFIEGFRYRSLKHFSDMNFKQQVYIMDIANVIGYIYNKSNPEMTALSCRYVYKEFNLIPEGTCSGMNIIRDMTRELIGKELFKSLVLSS